MIGADFEGQFCFFKYLVEKCDELQRKVLLPHTSAYVSIRQQQHTAAYVSIHQHTSAYGRIERDELQRKVLLPHTSAYVSIRPHTSAYALGRRDF
jgi:hypothetical protein